MKKFFLSVILIFSLFSVSADERDYDIYLYRRKETFSVLHSMFGVIARDDVPVYKNQTHEFGEEPIFYLDKNTKHMFELDRSIRLVNVNEYPVPDFDVLMGFICGLIAGNNDIEAIYFDSFLTLTNLEGKDVTDSINKLIILSDKLNVDFIVSLSMDESDLSDTFKEYVVLSL